MINYWVEQDLILADEFRDGNVPAGMDCLSSFMRTTRALPQSIETLYFRSDSAAYQHKLLDAMRDGIELYGKQVPVYFAISADVSEALRGKIVSLSDSAWKPLRRLTEKGLIEGRKEWAEVEFIPSDASVKKAMKPDRYLAIRVRPWQTELFSDGNSYHYYAVVTNRWEIEGEELLRWQRERCGSVEKVHDALKNDLAGGVMPCGRYYANAAWWRLNCLCYNVISIMKRKALPQSFWPVRMKASEVSFDWGSRQGGLARAHDVSENHRRADWLSAGEKPVGGVFQCLKKRCVPLTKDLRSPECRGAPRDLRQTRLNSD